MQIFFNIALYYSSLILLVLPIIGCAFISCAAIENSISVSALIHAEPLATAYAFFGAVFLMSVLYFQTTKKNVTRYVLAFIGGKLLAVPLIIPLNSVESNWYHISFAGAGFLVEYALICSVLYDCYSSKLKPRGTEVLVYSALTYFAGLVIGLCAFIPGIDKIYETYALMFAEYFIGFSLVVSAKTMDAYNL